MRRTTGAAATGTSASLRANPVSVDAEVFLRLADFVLDVRLAVAAGEVVAVTGPNGSGKTTLLRALAGLAPLERGRVTLGGRVVDDPSAGVWLPPERRGIGYAFQDLRLFPHLSVLANVQFGLTCEPQVGRLTQGGRLAQIGALRRAAMDKGVFRAAAPRLAARRQAPRSPAPRQAAMDSLEAVGMAEYAAVRPGKLSGGQAQRVALARALAKRPPLLLLDEALSAIDDDVRPRLRQLAARSGATVLMVSHEREAHKIADRLVAIEHGRAANSP